MNKEESIKKDEDIFKAYKWGEKRGYQKGWRVGAKYGKMKQANEMKKAMNEWHKHEQTGLEDKCKNWSCLCYCHKRNALISKGGTMDNCSGQCSCHPYGQTGGAPPSNKSTK